MYLINIHPHFFWHSAGDHYSVRIANNRSLPARLVRTGAVVGRTFLGQGRTVELMVGNSPQWMTKVSCGAQWVNKQKNFIRTDLMEGIFKALLIV